MNVRKLTERKTPPLAYCEYVSPDSNSIEVSIARIQLFETVKRVYPTFLEKLSSDVFPLYLEVAEAGCLLWGMDGPPHLSPYELINEGSVSSLAGHCADTPASMKKRENLKSALAKWAIQFNADRIWLMDDALRTLEGWRIASEWRESLKWKPFYGHSSSASTGDAFRFQCQGWETELLAWPRYKQYVRQRFEEELLKYEKQTRDLAESCGLVRARRKHSTANFDWFVLYQFAGWSSPKIADQWSSNHEGGVDDSTVLKGIKTTAKLIAWDVKRP
jgi:hypothetical protein